MPTVNNKLKQIISNLGPFIGLIAVLIFFIALKPAAFLKWGTYELMFMHTAIVGMAALGMTLVIISGGIDLSVGSAIALVTVSIALLLSVNVPPAVAVLGGIASGAICGALIGGLVTKLKLSPFIVTLGMWGAVRGAAKGMANNQTVSAPESPLNNLLAILSKEQQWMLFPVGVWLTIIAAIILYVILHYTKFGRHVFAIGSNEETARLCGVRVERTKLYIYVLAGVFTGLAGLLQFSQLTMGDPTAAMGKELDVIAAVVIGGGSLTGGVGSIAGTLVGAFIMTTVATGCTKLGLENWVQQIVTGVIIIVAVVIDQLRHSKPG